MSNITPDDIQDVEDLYNKIVDVINDSLSDGATDFTLMTALSRVVLRSCALCHIELDQFCKITKNIQKRVLEEIRKIDCQKTDISE